MIRGPVFSPDGRWLVLAASKDLWWSGDPDLPARGGPATPGHVVVFDMEPHEAREVEVIEDLPAGWMPADPHEADERAFLGLPEFIGPREFRVTLPTGTVKSFTTDAQGR